jgi:hypothetical protein
MAGTFTATGSYSNLTRKELEQLRRADFAAGGKALTIGDSGLLPEGVVGVGSVNAEPYQTLPSLFLQDVNSVAPSGLPLYDLSRLNQVADVPSPGPAEVAKWYGPSETPVRTGQQGFASDTTHWDDLQADFIAAGVNYGDLLIIHASETAALTNGNAVAFISGVSTTRLTLTSIRKTTGAATPLDAGTEQYAYTIVKPKAVQLFAVPGSGPLGREQTFLMVKPGSTLHSDPAPTLTAINADRIVNIIPPFYGLGDRADAIFGGPTTGGPGQGLDATGYRVILYKSDGSGTAPDMMSPIASLNPVIDSTIPAADQRMTIDYAAGVVRFSCAPRLGDDIKVTGGVGPAGRLSLFAVFWAVDHSFTRNSAATLYRPRSDMFSAREPGLVMFDVDACVWRLSSTTAKDSNFFYAQARASDEDLVQGVEFGTLDGHYPGPATHAFRYFRYTSGFGAVSGSWRFVQNGVSPSFTDSPTTMELHVGDKTALTMGDSSAPAQSPGADANPQQALPLGSQTGARDTTADLDQLLKDAFASGYGVVHLRKGRYYYTGSLSVPPGIILEGEGSATKLVSRQNVAVGTTDPFVKFGPNTPTGVYDPTSTTTIFGTFLSPLTFDLPDDVTVYGYDIAWNSNRRVWGVFQAIGTGLWFNEVRADGTRVYPAPTGTHASVTTVVAGVATITGLTDITPSVVGFNLTIFSAASGGNNGTFKIITYLSPTSVEVSNITAVGNDANNTFISWSLGTPGIDVKKTTTPFFNATSGNARNHTLGHYPRVAYHEGQDEYSVVWTQRNGGTGPTVMYQGVRTLVITSVFGQTSGSDFLYDSSTNFTTAGVMPGSSLQIVWGNVKGDFQVTGVSGNTIYLDRPVATDMGGVRYLLKGATTTLASPYEILADVPAPYNVCTDHPSVAVEKYSTGTGYKVAIGFWAYDGTLLNSTFATFAYTAGGGTFTNVTADHNGAMANQVVSSTDVDADDYGGFLYAYSIRSHPLYFGTAGASNTGDFTDAVFTGIWGSWAASGIQRGSRFLYLNDAGAAGNRGFDGVVSAFVNPSTIHLITTKPEPVGAVDYDDNTGIVWAIAPTSKLWVRRLNPGGFTDAAIALTDNDYTSNEYALEAREPDFVRISHGDNKWLLVYQSFNTTSYLSSDKIYNFDNGLDSSFIDAAGLTAKSPHPFREHLSTCAVLLNDAGQILSQAPRRIDVSAALATEHMARDIEVSSRSLSSRAPIGVRPNQGWYDTRSHDREVSALNFHHQWNTTLATPVVPSLIPDVTWTGSDWSIVSPSKGEIRSELGTYTVSGGVFYLSDPSFYFGDGFTPGHDGNLLRATLSNLGGGLFGEVVFFPDAGPSGTLAVITGIYDEHTITIDTDLSLLAPAIASGTTHVKWALADAGGSNGRIKNPGFRVASDGRLLMGTSYTTFADDTPPTNGTPSTSLTPLMYRKERNLTNSALNGIREDFGDDTHARIEGNIFYEGVAVGDKKGFSEKYAARNETPSVAIAWGDNCYGFLDRIYSGAVAPLARTAFYRQSFGPYQSGLRSLQVVGTNALSPTQYTFNHVYTRHGSPVTFTGGFATDGYRNCFVYPSSYSYTNALDPRTVMEAVYTDQTGRTKIRTRAHEQLNLLAVLSGQSGAAASITAFSSGHMTVTGLTGMTPQSVGHYLQINATTTLANRGYFPIIAYVNSTTVLVANPLGSAPDASNGSITWIESLEQQQNIRTEFMNDLWSNPNGSPYDYMAKSPTTPSSPVVIWDGSRFVACWTAANYSIVQPFNGFVCFGTMPGDEDGFEQGTELTGDAVIQHKITELARVSCGDQNGFPTILGTHQLYACDMAYSGKVYAAVWVAGTNPTDAAPYGGSAIGVAIFTGTGDASGAVSYLINASELTGAYTNPKILWDGKNFIVMWRRGSLPGGTDPLRQIEYAIVPETGLGYAVQVKRVAAEDAAIGKSFNANLGIGVIAGDGYLYDTIDHPVNCQPGDIVIVNKTRKGGVDDYRDAGGYVVLDHDLLTRKIFMHPSTSTTFKNVGPGTVVYGMILSGGIGDVTNLPQLAENTGLMSAAMSGINPRPKALGYGSWADLAPFGTTILRLNDAVYNDVTDEYAVLYTGINVGVGNSAIVLSTWKKGTFQFRQENVIVPLVGSEDGVASLAWNGHQYLVVYNNQTTGDLTWYMVTPSGQVQRSGTLATLTGSSGVWGIAEGQAPGPGFTAPVLTSNVKPKARKVTIRWNNRMSRWVISAGYLWHDDTGAAAFGYYTSATTQIPVAFPLLKSGANLNNVATWVGRTLTFNVADVPGAGLMNIQPGVRLFNVSANPVITPMVVHFDGNRTITLDTDVIEVSPASAADFTTNTPISVYIMPREDVFCWTISDKMPAVQLTDADEVTLHDVEITGSQVDIEERFVHMSRPVWQSGGPSFGEPSLYYRLRGSQYNHRFLTPANKVETLRLTNVKSTTATKYGYGFTPGNPYFDRTAFRSNNGRG